MVWGGVMAFDTTETKKNNDFFVLSSSKPQKTKNTNGFTCFMVFDTTKNQQKQLFYWFYGIGHHKKPKKQ